MSWSHCSDTFKGQIHHICARAWTAGSPLYKYTLQIVGIARGNPGHGALAIMFTNPSLTQVFNHRSRYLGMEMNCHLAEYQALITGLEVALYFDITHVQALGNSPVVVNQVLFFFIFKDFIWQIWCMCNVQRMTYEGATAVGFDMLMSLNFCRWRENGDQLHKRRSHATSVLVTS